MSVSVQLHRDVLVATIANAPVNALSAPVRAGLASALDRVENEPDIVALVIASSLPIFSAGADIREFAHVPVEPFLPDVLDRLAGCRVPTEVGS